MKKTTAKVAPSFDVGNLPGRIAAKIRVSSYAHPDLGTPCRLWTAGRDGQGYGVVWLDGSTRSAHRVVYEALVGPIPDGLQLDHLCRVRHCVFHLEPVTGKENIRRGRSANREKVHCPQGHPYSPASTLLDRKGTRHCRECQRASCRASYHRNRDRRLADMRAWRVKNGACHVERA